MTYCVVSHPLQYLALFATKVPVAGREVPYFIRVSLCQRKNSRSPRPLSFKLYLNIGSGFGRTVQDERNKESGGTVYRRGIESNGNLVR